jgi:hypothetical protein
MTVSDGFSKIPRILSKLLNFGAGHRLDLFDVTGGATSRFFGLKHYETN